MPHRKKHRKKLLVFALAFLASAAVGAYAAYGLNTQNTSSSGVLPPKEIINKRTPNVIKGELIVKLRDPIPELSEERFVISANNKNPEIKVPISEVSQNNLPAKLRETHKKYGIKEIERVFPRAESKNSEISNPDNYSVKTATVNAYEQKKSLLSSMARVYKLSLPSDAPVESIAKDLASDVNVEYAEPNYELELALTPNDTYFQYTSSKPYVNQWALSGWRKREAKPLPNASIDVYSGWEVSRGDSSMIVAVVDSGIDYTHPDLGGGIGPNKKVVGGYDFVNNDSDPMDDYGHGTHVAGIIAATGNNSQGVIGVCPNCRLMGLKMFDAKGGSGSSLKGANGIIYAVDNGAKVINASWGSTYGANILSDAIQYATSKDVLVVAAAGNHKSSKKFYPAAFPNVLSVASVDYRSMKADSSGYDDGSGWVDVSAPGVQILSTAAKSGPSCTDKNHETGVAGYSYCWGTSMASPHVAGVAALVRSKNPTWDYARVMNQITSTAKNIDRYNPGFEGKIGTGRVSAWYALTDNQTYCADSDWGLNYSTVGYLYGTGEGCIDLRDELVVDRCIDGTYLSESSCSSNTCKFVKYKCPKGCASVLGGCRK